MAGESAAGDVYVLADDSVRASPDSWARRAIAAYHQWHADELVAEGNQGGELVRLTLLTIDPELSVRIVHATHGKRIRAEPVAALYEQGRVHHVGKFTALEDQLCLWDADSGELSPDRLDALVWAVSELAVDRVSLRILTGDTRESGLAKALRMLSEPAPMKPWRPPIDEPRESPNGSDSAVEAESGE